MSIEIYWIKDFKLSRYPIIDSDESGTEKVRFRQTENIGLLPLLYDGTTYLTEFNSYLIQLKREQGKSDSTISNAAQGLLKFLEFIQFWNRKQEALQKKNPYTPKEPPMVWNAFPQPLTSRPTYAFKYFLEGKAKNGSLETTNKTTRLYMNAVVNFYKWRLALGEEFDYLPFKYTKHKQKSKSGKSIKESMISIDGTDMRLNLPKDIDADKRRELYPMNQAEWDATADVLKGGYGLSYKIVDEDDNGEEIKKSQRTAISIEHKLAIKLSRWAGLRRNEFITFRLSCTKQLTASQKQILEKGEDRYITGIRLAPKDGVFTKGMKPRNIEIPLSLMKELREYLESDRYITRLDKFKENFPDDPYDSPPVFITQSGKLYDRNTVNADWGRVRNAVREAYPNLEFDHKYHNLRSTYATGRYLYLRRLFSRHHGNDKGNDMALTYIGNCLGHENHTVTINYLKYASQVTHGNDIYEEYLSMTHGKEEQEMLTELDKIRAELKKELQEKEDDVQDVVGTIMNKEYH
ncbi:phage integrase [Photobacterium marinum]|uniref:Phage integrase n=1 Tax=Photobacterium marinum TaxID=1056511 RepID=L8JHF8_9GAMM|nr:site-specific integrase [Photobacterium marinum]ELR66969.1 phage integrase [Photobacterium marinum]